MRKHLKYFKSWTLSVNTVTVIVMAVEAQLGYLREAIPDQYEPWMIAAIAVTNILLRLRTDKPVSEYTK